MSKENQGGERNCTDVLSVAVQQRDERRHKDHEEVAINLWSIITDFGVPKIIQSDNGLEFVNGTMTQLAQLYGIDHRLITAYHFRADGLVERRNKEVNRSLKKQMKNMVLKNCI